MANTNFNTSNETFRKLFGNGIVYRIPSFQRDYSWKADEWEDLWEDIVELLSGTGESAHYMGYLVLQSNDSKAYDVIDGQQRLTTLSIIVLAAISYLGTLAEEGEEPERNRTRAEQLRNSYIGYLDPVSLVPQSKLTLNRNNDSFYQTYLVPLVSMPQRGLRASEHALRKAFLWYCKAIEQRCGKSGEETARLIDHIVDQLFFTVITVTDELNAFKVFETLNARGVRLSSTDLLKNYLFSVVSKSDAPAGEVEAMEKLWERVVGTLGAESLPEFLRIFWNSRHKLVRKADLFKTIRKEVKDRRAAFQLVRSLDESAHIYAALRNPDDELWEPSERDALEELQTFRVRQQIAMLLAAFEAFGENDRATFQSILKAVSVISFRYNVIGNLQANDQEKRYNEVALAISEGEFTTKKEVLDALRPVYIEDDNFQNDFSTRELNTTNSRNRKVVRYLLCRIENHLGTPDPDPLSKKISIEHICPENPDDDGHWSEELVDYVYRLGNMIPLETGWNRDIGNAEYPDKAGDFQKSGYRLPRYVAENYDDWNAQIINKFQQYMARQATSIWRIDF